MAAIVSGTGTKTVVKSTTATSNPITLMPHETQAGIATISVEGHKFDINAATASDLLPYLTKLANTGSLF